MNNILLRRTYAVMVNTLNANPTKPQLPCEMLSLLLICLAVGTSESTNLRQDLAPSLDREQRSILSSETLNMMLPLLASKALTPPNAPANQANNQRQLPTDGKVTPAVPADPTATASPLTQLLPFLLGPFGGFNKKLFGGSVGSFEVGKGGRLLTNVLLAKAISNALSQTPATTTTTSPSSANLVAGPGRRLRKKAELRMTNVASNKVTGEKNQVAVRSPSDVMDDRCSSYVPRSQVCNDLPVDKILAMKNAVVVFKGRNVYRVRPSGEPFDLEPTTIDEKVEPLTATAAIGDAQYVFQGDKYTKYDSNFRQAIGVYPKLVSEGFPGVLTPVDGVFKLNNHTYVFASGTKFVYFQPDANPQVDPRYSPQYLDNIPGAPATIDSVFTLKDRKFLHKEGMIYELSPDEMKVTSEIPVVSSTKEGWLKCPDLFPARCNHRQLDGTSTTAASEPFALP